MGIFTQIKVSQIIWQQLNCEKISQNVLQFWNNNKISMYATEPIFTKLVYNMFWSWAHIYIPSLDFVGTQYRLRG